MENPDEGTRDSERSKAAGKGEDEERDAVEEESDTENGFRGDTDEEQRSEERANAETKVDERAEEAHFPS